MAVVGEKDHLDHWRNVFCGHAGCNKSVEIVFWGFTREDVTIVLCPDHALQLSRKLLEDLCELSPGGRHG